MSTNFHSLIEEYVSGKLSGETLAQFESQMKQDTELRESVEFEKQIAEGVRAARRAELKARLNALETPSGVSNTGLYLKIAAGVIILLGLFWWLMGDNKTVKPVEESTEQVTLVPGTQPGDPLSTIPVEEKATPTPKKASREAKQEAEGEAPDFSSNMNGLDVTENQEITEIANKDLGSKVEIDRKMATIQVNNTTAYKSHYQYLGATVVLYGDYENKKFELLQLNSSAKTRLFITIENRFYEIDLNSTSINTLTETTDKEIIKELKQRL